MGYPRAEWYVGYCYDHGYGVEISRTEAETWFSKAEEHGFSADDADIGDGYPDIDEDDIPGSDFDGDSDDGGDADADTGDSDDGGDADDSDDGGDGDDDTDDSDDGDDGDDGGDDGGDDF